MKIITLLLALFAVVSAERPWNLPKALNVRGGAELGPLDGELAMKLAKTATTAYAAGAASKYISGQTGGSSTQLADFVTTDLWALNALCTAVAAAMFQLAGTGFDSLKMLAVAYAASLLLRLDSGGFSTNTVMDNKVQTGLAVVLGVLAFA